ncbi:MAG: hypothetical protein ACWGOL_08750 [Desulfuromonadales bacterium]
MKRHYLMYCCLALLLAACAPPWKVMPVDEAATGKSYRVELPAGWMRNTANQKVLIISHDGNLLQGIEIREESHNDAFKKIGETSSPGMLPSELAELVLALVKNDLPASRVELLDNKPVHVAGHQGFRMHLKYQTSKGLDYEGIITGFVTDEYVYMIRYYGTSLYYFPRDLPVYEKLVASFQVT